MTAAFKNPTLAEASLLKAYEAIGAPTDAQRTAWAAFADAGLPHRRMEEWKWTDVRAALRQALIMPPAQTAPVADGAFTPLNPLEIVFVDGRFAWWSEDDPLVEQIVSVHNSPSAPLDVRGLPMGALSAALSPDGDMTIIDVEKSCARPIWLRFIAELDGAARLTRVGIKLGRGAHATILESYEGMAAGFDSVLIEGFVEADATLERVVLQSAAPDNVFISTADIRLKDRARLKQTTLAFGAALARLETRVAHEGEGASAGLNSATLLSHTHHCDQTTSVRHACPGGKTHQRARSVVADRATGIFQGKFHVERAGQKTDARMHHAGLLLSEKATITAKPELVIYADDVQCAHGNTVGALDEQALFYMRQRGLSETRARALLVEAFISEVFDGAGDDGVRATLRGEAKRWLEAHL